MVKCDNITFENGVTLNFCKGSGHGIGLSTYLKVLVGGRSIGKRYTYEYQQHQYIQDLYAECKKLGIADDKIKGVYKYSSLKAQQSLTLDFYQAYTSELKKLIDQVRTPILHHIRIQIEDMANTNKLRIYYLNKDWIGYRKQKH